MIDAGAGELDAARIVVGQFEALKQDMACELDKLCVEAALLACDNSHSRAEPGSGKAFEAGMCIASRGHDTQRLRYCMYPRRLGG